MQAYPARLSEDYYIIHLREALDEDGRPLTAPVMLAKRGEQIAQIVRGESQPLAESERREVLQSSLSYYPSRFIGDWLGGGAGLRYPGGRCPDDPVARIREHAVARVPALRRCSDARLGGTYIRRWSIAAELFRRWRMAREAERLNTLRLDVRELTERTDNAIKFLSDMFYARAYRIAAARVGVTDYRNLVEEKAANRR